MVITFGYHYGINLGPNLAEAVNYFDREWIKDGQAAEGCKLTCGKCALCRACQECRDGIKIPMEPYTRWEELQSKPDGTGNFFNNEFCGKLKLKLFVSRCYGTNNHD